MKRHVSLFAALVPALFAGCATPARHHTYEYVFQHGADLNAVQDNINKLAKDGWDVQSMTVDGGYKYILLKRERIP